MHTVENNNVRLVKQVPSPQAKRPRYNNDDQENGKFTLSSEISLPPRSIKRLSSAISALAKIGKEIYLEVVSGGKLKALAMNDARTALPFTFASSPETFQCSERIAAKLSPPIPKVFRSTRMVERLVISFVSQGPRHIIAFTSHCKFGVVKSHRFFYEACDALQPVFDGRCLQSHRRWHPPRGSPAHERRC